MTPSIFAHLLRLVSASLIAVAASLSFSCDSAAANRLNLSGLNSTDRYDRFIVKYRSADTPVQAALDRRAKAFGVRHLRRMALGADVVQSFRKLDRVEAESLMRALAADPAVEYVEVDARVQHTLIPNDIARSYLWAYTNGATGIHPYPIWDYANGAGTVVAVLDTGITSHSDLNANVLPGYDFIADLSTARDGNGRDSNPSDPGDWVAAGECGAGRPAINSSWHGTHVAGTIAAVGNNNYGVVGVAYGAKIVPVRVLGRCGGWQSDIADAIVWASGGAVAGVPANPYPAKVLNLSLGGYFACPNSYQNAINSAVARAVTVVAAAGNGNTNVSGFSPANCNNLIAVGATNSSGVRASFSNFGAGIDISAPGEVIESTINTGITTPAGESFAAYNGTSMATPHVSGIIALMHQYRSAVGYERLHPDQIEALLKDTAYPLNGFCYQGCGAGIADATSATRIDQTVKIFEKRDTSNKLQIAVFERMSPYSAGIHSDFMIPVPPDYVVVGGGAEADNLPVGNMLTASHPNPDLSAWVVSTKDHIQASPTFIRGWAIGLKINGLTAQQLRGYVFPATALSARAGTTDVTAYLPAGYVLLGGGFRVNWGGWGNMATASAPVGNNGWRVRSKDHTYASAALTQAYAIGIRREIPGIAIINASYNSSTSAVTGHASHKGVFNYGSVLTGCGGHVNWSGAGNFLWRIRPYEEGFPPNSYTGCYVSSKDHFVADPSSITWYALGIYAN